MKARRWWDVRVRRVSEWIDLTEFRTMLAAIGGEEAGFSWWIERSRGGGVADGNLDWKVSACHFPSVLDSLLSLSLSARIGKRAFSADPASAKSSFHGEQQSPSENYQGNPASPQRACSGDKCLAIRREYALL